MEKQKVIIIATIIFLLICLLSLILTQPDQPIEMVVFSILFFTLLFFSESNYTFFRIHSENTLLSLSEALTAMVSIIAYFFYPIAVLLISMLITVTIANTIQLTDIMRSILINSFLIVSSLVYLLIISHTSKKAQTEAEFIE